MYNIDCGIIPRNQERSVKMVVKPSKWVGLFKSGFGLKSLEEKKGSGNAPWTVLLCMLHGAAPQQVVADYGAEGSEQRWNTRYT